MNLTQDTLLNEALKLPAQQRGTLAQALWQSIDGADDPPLSEEWRQEIKRRMEAVERGEVELIPLDQAMRQVRDPLESLEDEDNDASIDPQIEAAWAAEAQRRLEEYRRDPSKAIDAEEFFARIERKLPR